MNDFDSYPEVPEDCLYGSFRSPHQKPVRAIPIYGVTYNLCFVCAIQAMNPTKSQRAAYLEAGQRKERNNQ